MVRDDVEHIPVYEVIECCYGLLVSLQSLHYLSSLVDA